ncbi:uncharacterized, partial [Tachysurus ichikawai]
VSKKVEPGGAEDQGLRSPAHPSRCARAARRVMAGVGLPLCPSPRRSRRRSAWE